jgi:hypothetical protein
MAERLRVFDFVRNAQEKPRQILAERLGVFKPTSRNPNKDGLFSDNSHCACHLAFSDSFVGLRPFASVFWFCQRKVFTATNHSTPVAQVERASAFWADRQVRHPHPQSRLNSGNLNHENKIIIGDRTDEEGL